MSIVAGGGTRYAGLTVQTGEPDDATPVKIAATRATHERTPTTIQPANITMAAPDPLLGGDDFTQVNRQKRRHSGPNDEIPHKKQQRPERTFTPPGPPSTTPPVNTPVPTQQHTPTQRLQGLAQSMHAPRESSTNHVTRTAETADTSNRKGTAHAQNHNMDLDDFEDMYLALTEDATTHEDDDNMSQNTADDSKDTAPIHFQTPTAPPAHSGRQLLLQLLETEEAPPPRHTSSRTKASMPPSLPTENPIDATPAPTFTPKPATDFPTRHLSDPLALFKNMDKTQRKKWFGHPGPIAAIQVWGERATGNDATIKDLTEALQKALDKPPSSFRISTPIRENNQQSCPPSYCLSQITSIDFYRLTEQKCWSFKDPKITFFVTPFTWTTPKFICALQGISAPHLPTLRDTIINTILERTATAIQEIAERNRPEGGIVPPDFAAQIANTVELALLPTSAPGGHNEPKVCLYINSPTDNMAQWIEFCDMIANLTFDVGLDGEGTRWEYAPCSGCYGADHPRGLCPYRTIPGWNGKRGGRSIRP